MAITLNDGPNFTIGPMIGGNNTTGALEYSQDAGPSVTYQGDLIPDPRNYPFPKDYAAGWAPGSMKGFLDQPYIQMVDAVPVAAGTAVIAALANVTSGTAMTLVTTAQTGISPGVPIIPNGSATATNALAIEFGFTTCSVTSGSVNITVTAANFNVNYFWVGQWLAIANVGNAGGTTTLFTQVLSISGPSGGNYTLVGSVAAGKTQSGARVGSCNIPSYWGSNPTPNAVMPFIFGPTSKAGAQNPAECLSRCISITGTASGTGGTFTVRGYDVYGYAMTETITVGAGVTTAYGLKAWKYVISVTPNFTDAHNYSVGIGDTFGLHIRTDRWEYTNLFWNGGFLSSSTGWLAADTTTPATATTGDVRGTLQLGVNGAGSGATGSPDGSKRLSMYVSVPPYQMYATTPTDPTKMFGVSQYSG